MSATKAKKKPTPAQRPMTNRLAYSVNEVLELLPISRASLYRRIKDGALPMRKVGGRTFILKTDLERLLGGITEGGQ
jgi:excisionase family DNA binding protein